MLRQIYRVLGLAVGILPLLAGGCSSEMPDDADEMIAVTLATRAPSASDDDGLHADLAINDGVILIYDRDGNYETGAVIDADRKMTSVVVSKGKKRIVAVINPSKDFRSLIAEDCHERVLDEFGNPKVFNGVELWRDIKPVYEKYSDLSENITFSEDCLKAVRNSGRMLLVHDKEVLIDSDDDSDVYIELPLTVPMSRVDLHARVLPAEQKRVVDAALRVSHISPSLKWDLTRPPVEGTVEEKYTGISDRMTLVTSEDELFGDWVMANVKENLPIARLYTYATDTNVRLEIGLRFDGSVDYDWYPVDMAELMKPDIFRGLESGHLYQIFITVYPDKVGHIIVDPWIVPTNLIFTIG